MFEVIQRMFNVLNMVKDFEAGTSSKSENKMIINYKGKRYVVELEEIKYPSENVFDDIKRYLYK